MLKHAKGVDFSNTYTRCTNAKTLIKSVNSMYVA